MSQPRKIEWRPENGERGEISCYVDDEDGTVLHFCSTSGFMYGVAKNTAKTRRCLRAVLKAMEAPDAR